MPKSPSSLTSGLAKAASAGTSKLAGSSVGPAQTAIIRTDTLTFATKAEFRTYPLTMTDGTVFAIKGLGQWMYRADQGAGVADDDSTVLKQSIVDTADPGRAYVHSSISLRLPNGDSVAASEVVGPSAVADLSALAGVAAYPGESRFVVGNGLWDCVDRSNVAPDGITQIAGTYTPYPIGWIKRGYSTPSVYDRERAVIDRVALAVNSLWYHPDFGKSFSTDACTGWLDYLVSVIPGHSAINATDAVAPANRWIRASLANGCPAIEDVNGTSYLQMSGASSPSGSHTFCCTVEMKADLTGYQIIFPPANTGEVGFELGTNVSKYGILHQGQAHVAITGADTVTGEQTVCWVYDSAAGTAKVYLNGRRIATLTGQTARAWAPYLLGNSANGPKCKLASALYVAGADTQLVAAYHAWSVARCGSPSWKTIELYDDLALDSARDFRCAQAQNQVSTTATKALLEWSCATYTWPTQSEVALYRNGALHTTASATGAGAQDTSVVLDGGSQTLLLRDGVSQGTDSPINRNRIERVHLNDASAALQTVAAPTNRLVVYADSIGAGFSADNPTSEAWPMLLRATFDGRVTNYSRGSNGVYCDLDTPEKRATVAARIAALCDGTVSNKVWIALGYNDKAAGWSTTLFGAAYADLLDRIHALSPNAVVFAQSPITATVDTGLPAYRTATQTACSGRSWVTYVDGTTVTTALSGDGIHPTTAGFISYASFVAAAIA